MSSTDVVTVIVGGLFTGGMGVALVKGWFALQLRKIDQTEKDVVSINNRFDDLFDKYMTIVEEHTILKGQSENQQHEIQQLKRRLKELQGYRSQQLKINRLTKVLHDYYKTSDVKTLISKFEKELM